MLLDLLRVARVEHLPASVQIKLLQPSHVVVHVLYSIHENVPRRLNISHQQQSIYLVVHVDFPHDVDFGLDRIFGFFGVVCQEDDFRAVDRV